MTDWGDDWGGSSTPANSDSNNNFQRNSFSSRNGSGRPQSFTSCSSANPTDSSGNCVKIYGFDDRTSGVDLRQIFGRFGTITHLLMVYPVADPAAKCTCWLTYQEGECVQTAIRKCNNRELRGRSLTVTQENCPFSGEGETTSSFSASTFNGRSSRPPPSSSGCFNCGQEGHRKHECPEPRKPFNRSAPYPPRGGGGRFGGRNGSANDVPLGSGSGGGGGWGDPVPPKPAALDSDGWGGGGDQAPQPAPPSLPTPAPAPATAGDDEW